MKIKVCGMNDPANASRIAGLPIDYMGFIFYSGSKRYVGATPDESLFTIIPGRILKTGIFVEAELSMITDSARRYHLDLIQLHGNESVDYCRSLYKAGQKIIKAFGIDSRFDFNTLDAYLDVCDFFLFDYTTGNDAGSGLKFDWRKIEEYQAGKAFFLSGGIGPDDAELIKKIKHKDLYGVDINSRFEISPGLKDIKKVESFIKKLIVE